MASNIAEWSSRSLELSRLLAQAGLGDKSAFAGLYKLTSAHLFGVILRITRDRAQAEEVLQDVFVSVWQTAGGFDAQLSQPMTWLTSVARNRAIDGLRRQAREPAGDTRSTDREKEQDVIDDLADGAPGPLERLAQTADTRLLANCIGLLAPQHRQCLALAFYNGLSHAEVSKSMGEPLGTVKSWLRRSLNALKQCIEHTTIAS